MYTKVVSGACVRAAVTVDYFCIATAKMAAFRRVLAELRTKYQAKDHGPVRRLLGWTVQPTADGGLHLYPFYWVARFVAAVARTVTLSTSTLYVEEADKHSVRNSELLTPAKKHLFASAVGQMRYLQDSTRADLSLITSELASLIAVPMHFRWRLLN